MTCADSTGRPVWLDDVKRLLATMDLHGPWYYTHNLSLHYSSCWHVNSSNTIAWCLFPLLRTRLAVTSNLLNGTRSRDRDAEAILGESDALPAVFAAGGRSKTRLALCGQPPPDGLYIHTLQHPLVTTNHPVHDHLTIRNDLRDTLPLSPQDPRKFSQRARQGRIDARPDPIRPTTYPDCCCDASLVHGACCPSTRSPGEAAEAQDDRTSAPKARGIVSGKHTPKQRGEGRTGQRDRHVSLSQCEHRRSSAIEFKPSPRVLLQDVEERHDLVPE